MRFRSLSYRDIIYPWVKNEIYPDINEKDIYLRSAVEQYIDHLEGMFSLRKIDKEMNMKLQEFIIKELGLKDSIPAEAIKSLSEKEAELNNAISQIQQLKSKYQKQIVVSHFEKWEKSLRKDYRNLDIVGDTFNHEKNCVNVGIEFHIENQTFVALIECNDYNKQNIYIGIREHLGSKIKYKTPEILHNILNETKLVQSDDHWYGWKYTSLENGYMRLKTLIDKIISQTVV